MVSSQMDLHFQSSLRGGGESSVGGGGDVKLHRGCSGALHGHGVNKIRTRVPQAPCQRDRSCMNGGAPHEISCPLYHQVEEPTRKKSMLGLGLVLGTNSSGPLSPGRPPRSPPRMLSHANRSLSSSSTSSSSSSKYSSSCSGSPSPDPFSSPLLWPTAAQLMQLERVREEDDVDYMMTDAGSSSCYSPSPSYSSMDQGRPVLRRSNGQHPVSPLYASTPKSHRTNPNSDNKRNAATPTLTKSGMKSITPRSQALTISKSGKTATIPTTLNNGSNRPRSSSASSNGSSSSTVANRKSPSKPKQPVASSTATKKINSSVKPVKPSSSSAKTEVVETTWAVYSAPIIQFKTSFFFSFHSVDILFPFFSLLESLYYFFLLGKFLEIIFFFYVPLRQLTKIGQAM